jgi:hypothetical protein
MRTLLLLCAAAVYLPGQPLEFTVAPAIRKPAARLDGTIAYDDRDQKIYLFGGDGASPRNDLWVYDTAIGAWQELTPAGAKPEPRFGHGLVFDPVRRRLIVFGVKRRGSSPTFGRMKSVEVRGSVWRIMERDPAGGMDTPSSMTRRRIA